jgi:type I restriction enzyme M protein
MFLKFLADREQLAEGRTKLRLARSRPLVELPYRWRAWAAKEDGTSGDALRRTTRP